MANKTEERSQKEEIKVDGNAAEIIKKANSTVPLTEAQIKKELEESQERIDFLQILEKFDLKVDGYHVIFSDGEEQLIYEDGAFYIESTVDASEKKRKKKTKSEARDMYLEYFIKYQLNPIIRQKEKGERIQVISGRDEMLPEEVETILKREEKQNEEFELEQKQKLEDKKVEQQKRNNEEKYR